MTSLTSVDKITDSFPHPTVTSIVGEPSYETLNALLRMIKANAASVNTELGGGNLGHLALTVSTITYSQLAPTTPFVVPFNPGPVYIAAANLTGPQMIEGERAHREALRIWNLYKNTDKAIKRQVIDTVEPVYIRALKHRHTGFANITTLTILEHLFQYYGKISPHDLEENNTRFRNKWDPSQPFELLVEQIEDATDYAIAGGTPYTVRQVLDNAYTLVFSTGMFPEASREWQNTTPVQQTWEHFKQIFYVAHNDLREMQTHTAQGGGFHGANQAMEQFCQETAASFNNMANAAVANRDILAQINKTNQELMARLQVKDAELASLRRQIQQGTVQPPEGQ